MIYVSTACVRARRIKEAVEKLARFGFSNIELSGGTDHYTGLEVDLIALQRNHGLSFLAHNYFPPPAEPLVINLASGDGGIYAKTIAQLKRGVDLCRVLGLDRFSFHAGFLADLRPEDLGRPIQRRGLCDRQAAVEIFCRGYEEIRAYAKGLRIYVENNVLLPGVYREFNNRSPFLFTDFAGYRELRERIDFMPLLDVAHLEISCRTLGLDFAEALRSLLAETDYLHVGDTNEACDQDLPLRGDGVIVRALKQFRCPGKTITLEIKGQEAALKSSYEIAKGVLE